jgi:hypothetical protein
MTYQVLAIFAVAGAVALIFTLIVLEIFND